MSADTNIKTIQEIYEAFGQGDVAAILDRVTDDIDWASETDSTAAPWWGVRHGKDEVGSFFADFGSTMEVQEFTPLTFVASDGHVLTVVNYRAKAIATGNEVAMQLHHQFRLENGKVAYYRGTEDTAQTERALQG